MKFTYNATLRVTGGVEAPTEWEAKQKIASLAGFYIEDDEEMELDDTEVTYIEVVVDGE